MSDFNEALRDSRLGRLLFVAPLSAAFFCLVLKALFLSLDITSLSVGVGMVVVSALVFLAVDLHFRGTEKIDEVRADYRKLEKTAERYKRLLKKISKLLEEENPDRLSGVLEAKLRELSNKPAPVVLEKLVPDKQLQSRVVELEANLKQAAVELSASRTAEAALSTKLQREQALRIACVEVNEETLEQLRISEEYRGELAAQLELSRRELCEYQSAQQRSAEEWQEQAHVAEATIASLNTEVAGLQRQHRVLVTMCDELSADLSALQQQAVDPKLLNHFTERCYVEIADFRAKLFLVTAIYWKILEDTADKRLESEGLLQEHDLWKVFQHLMREMVPLNDIRRVLRRLPASLKDAVKPKERELTLRWYLAAENRVGA